MSMGINTIGGVQFHTGTGNHTICGTVVFSCHDLSSGRRQTKTYRLTMHPAGWDLYQKRENTADEWDLIVGMARREDVLALLPKSDVNWTWQLFSVAFTAYGYGNTDGIATKPSDANLASLEALLKMCWTTAHLDEITAKWAQEHQNVSDAVYQRGVESIALVRPRMMATGRTA